MKDLTITKANDQDIEKTGNKMNNLDETLQKQPDKVSDRQVELDSRLSRLANLNNNLITRWSLSKDEKALIKIDEKASQEALQLIRKGENDNLSAIADYQTRYLKTILHNLVVAGESNMTGAAKVHYENAKSFLHQKLLVKMEEMTLILQEFEERAMNRPEKFRKVLIEASNKTLEQWDKDFKLHIEEFKKLLDKTFSRP